MTRVMYRIVGQCIPILLMLGLIRFVQNDHLLAALYVGIIVASLSWRYESLDLAALIFGALGMTVAETLFVWTGTEIFTRTSLFGLMPLWLPLLWGYAFVVIKRSLTILQSMRYSA